MARQSFIYSESGFEQFDESFREETKATLREFKQYFPGSEVSIQESAAGSGLYVVTFLKNTYKAPERPKDDDWQGAHTYKMGDMILVKREFDAQEFHKNAKYIEFCIDSVHYYDAYQNLPKNPEKEGSSAARKKWSEKYPSKHVLTINEDDSSYSELTNNDLIKNHPTRKGEKCIMLNLSQMKDFCTFQSNRAIWDYISKHRPESVVACRFSDSPHFESIKNLYFNIRKTYKNFCLRQQRHTENGVEGSYFTVDNDQELDQVRQYMKNQCDRLKIKNDDKMGPMAISFGSQDKGIFISDETLTQFAVAFEERMSKSKNSVMM